MLCYVLCYNIMNISQYYVVMLEINAALVSLTFFAFILFWVPVLGIHVIVLFCFIFHFSLSF